MLKLEATSRLQVDQFTTYTGMNLAWAAVMKCVTALISPLAPLWNPWRKRLYEMRYAVMASITFTIKEKYDGIYMEQKHTSRHTTGQGRRICKHGGAWHLVLLLCI